MMKGNRLLPTVGAVALILTAILLAIMIVAVLYAAASGHAGAPQGYVTVSASGSASEPPSQALLYVTVNGTGPTVQGAVSNMSAAMQGVNSTLYGYLGGNASMISTTQYNVYRTYNRSTYTATESVTVTVPNVSDVNQALGALSRLNQTYVTGVSARLSDSQVSELRGEALKSALLNATEQAGQLVYPKDVRLTNASISSYVIRPYPMYAASAAASGVPTREVTPSFFGGTAYVSESITAVFSYG